MERKTCALANRQPAAEVGLTSAGRHCKLEAWIITFADGIVQWIGC